MAILPIGLPKSDWLTLSRASADELVQGLFAAATSCKVVTQPTFSCPNDFPAFFRFDSCFTLQIFRLNLNLSSLKKIEERARLHTLFIYTAGCKAAVVRSATVTLMELMLKNYSRSPLL